MIIKNKDDNDNNNNIIKALKTENDNLKSDITNLINDNSNNTNTINDLNNNIASLQNHIRILEEHRNDTNTNTTNSNTNDSNNNTNTNNTNSNNTTKTNNTNDNTNINTNNTNDINNTTTTDDDTNDISKQLNDANNNNNKLQLKIKSLEDEITSLSSSLSSSNINIDTLSSSLSSLSLSYNQLLIEHNEKCQSYDVILMQLNEALIVNSKQEMILLSNNNDLKELQYLRNENIKLNNNIKDADDHKEALQQYVENATIENEKLKIQIFQLDKALTNAEEEGTRKQGEEIGELITAKVELQSKSLMVEELRQQVSKLQAQLHISESFKTSMDSQRIEIISQKDTMSIALQQKEEELIISTKIFEQKESSLRSQLLTLEKSTKQRQNELISELEQVHAIISLKDEEIQGLKMETLQYAKSMNTVQAQADNYRIKLEATSKELHKEIEQNKDRKNKIKEKWTELTEEKRILAENFTKTETQMVEVIKNNKLLEQQIATLEMKLGTAKEQVALERESKRRELESLESMMNMKLADKQIEIDNLKLQWERRATSIEEEAKEAQRILAMNSKELEEHKNKRLTARSEMIGMAETLERAHKDGEEIKTYLHYSLAPIVFEQINSMEALLSTVEHSFTQLSSNRFIKLKIQANDALSKRFKKTERVKKAESADSSDFLYNKQSHNPINNLSRKQMKSNANSIPAIRDAMEQAENIRNELERVQAGIILLSQSLEKLIEVINVETKCCGGVFGLITSSLPSYTSITKPIGQKKGYDQLEADGDSPTPISRPTAGRYRKDPMSGSFTIEAVDDD